MLLQYAGGKRFGPPVQLLICMMPIKPAVSKHKPTSRRAHSAIFITMDITKYANDPLPKNKGDNAPYLDQISSGHLGSFRKTQQYKKLLIQPIQIPNLQHCGISSELVSTQTAENPYIAPDGKATQTLRNTIQNVLPAIRKSYLTYQAKKKEREAYNDEHLLEGGVEIDNERPKNNMDDRDKRHHGKAKTNGNVALVPTPQKNNKDAERKTEDLSDLFLESFTSAVSPIRQIISENTAAKGREPQSTLVEDSESCSSDASSIRGYPGYDHNEDSEGGFHVEDENSNDFSL